MLVVVHEEEVHVSSSTSYSDEADIRDRGQPTSPSHRRSDIGAGSYVSDVSRSIMSDYHRKYRHENVQKFKIENGDNSYK